MISSKMINAEFAVYSTQCWFDLQPCCFYNLKYNNFFSIVQRVNTFFFLLVLKATLKTYTDSQWVSRPNSIMPLHTQMKDVYQMSKDIISSDKGQYAEL